jgi:chromosome partitioning protein
MAMAQPDRKEPDFADLFAQPTIDRMLTELTDSEFEHFVEYVFQRAGYTVEYTATQHRSGLDLKVYDGLPSARTLHAGMQVKQYSTTKVTAPEVVSLRGGLPAASRVTGYFVTTGTFNRQALDEAKNERRIWPIDGDHFLRYIAYIRGSRSKPGASGSKNAVPVGAPPLPISPEPLFAADSISWRLAAETKVLAVANHKGGVGKTTTALNLAFGLAGLGKQALLIDLDPQTNSTQAVPSPDAQHAAAVHVGEYFAGHKPLPQLVRRTHFGRLWLIPADPDLRHEDKGTATGPEAELRFVRDLHSSTLIPPPVLATHPFDWIIIDTGPQMGFLTRAALAASHYVLMALEPGAFADMGLELLLPTVEAIRALTGKQTKILGCVVTQWKDSAVNRDLLAKAKARLANEHIDIIEPKIPDDPNHIEKAHLETIAGGTRNLFNRVSPSSRAYTEVIEEVLSRVN